MPSLWPLEIVPQNLARCGVTLWRARGVLQATVVVKATFGLVADQPAKLLGPLDLVRAERRREGDVGRSVEAAPELAPYLPRCDVLLAGHAQTYGTPTASMAVRLGVYRDAWLLQKTLHVFGDRAAPDAPPRPFDKMPIVYERAYGGRGFEDNPVGVGAAQGSRLSPNVVDAAEPRRPAGFGPLAASWGPRARLLGGRPPPSEGARIVEIPEGFDWRFLQAAPADQQLEPLRGDEWIVLDGLHPTSARFRTRLPGVAAQARWYVAEGAALRPGGAVELRADMLIVHADRAICEVVWRGGFAIDEARLASVRVHAGVSLPGRPLEWPDKAAAATAARAAWPTTATTASAGPRPPNVVPAPPPVPVFPVAAATPRPPPVAQPPAPPPPPAPLPRAPGPPAPTPDRAPPSSDRPLGATVTATSPFVRAPMPFAGAATEPSARTRAAEAPRATGEIPGAPWSTRRPPMGDTPTPAPAVPPAPTPPAAPSAPSWIASTLAPRVDAPLDETYLTDRRTTSDEETATALTPAPRSEAPPDSERTRLLVVRTTPSAAPSAMPFVPRAASAPQADASALPPLPPALPFVAATPPPVAPAPVAPPPAAPPSSRPAPGLPPLPPPFAAAPPPSFAAPPSFAHTPEAVAPAPHVAPAPPIAPPAALHFVAQGSSNEVRDRVLARLRAGEALLGAELTGADLRGVDFSGRILAGAKLARANLAGCNFTEARLSGAHLEGALLEAAVLARADLSEVDLSRATLTGAAFDGATLKSANLARATCHQARFDDADLSGANLARVTGDAPSFRRATLEGADVRQAKLRRARFDDARLAGLVGANVDLGEASLVGADLRGASLRSASLRHASLRGANLDGADLRDADLEAADVRGATREGTRTSGARTKGLVEGVDE